MAKKLPKYLTRRKGGWLWVQIAVPEEAQTSIKKTVLRQYLNTTDVEIAEIEMGQYVTTFKRQIKLAINGGQSAPSAMETAIALRGKGLTEEAAIDVARRLPTEKDYQQRYAAFKSPALTETMQVFDFVDTAMGRRTPLTYYLDAFIANYKGRASHTVETRRADVKKLERWLSDNGEEQTVEAISRPLAVKFKRDLHNRGAKRATVNKTLGSLRMYWKHMLDEGVVSGVSPWAGVSVLKVDAQGTENPPIRDYSDAELLKILKAATDQDRKSVV